MESALWQCPLPEGWQEELVEIAASVERARIFFRADDIGTRDDRFRQMMHIFRQNLVPLNLAVVPAWMNRRRLAVLEEFDLSHPLWCWHQHGFSHRNHEKQGKKCEFGPGRSRQALEQDLRTGRRLLQKWLADTFFPVFTPPWNRCTAATLDLLADLGFVAVSRFQGARPSSGPLPDLAVNVDLHTRKGRDPEQDWQQLCRQIRAGLESGTLGVMLHHDRMNARARHFLEVFFSAFDHHVFTSFRDLAADPGTAGSD